MDGIPWLDIQQWIARKILLSGSMNVRVVRSAPCAVSASCSWRAHMSVRWRVPALPHNLNYVFADMLYTSPYKPLQLPDNVSAPDFVLRYSSDEIDNRPLFQASPKSQREHVPPLTLAALRNDAKSMAAMLLSKDAPGGAWSKGDVMMVYSENQFDYLRPVLAVMLAGGAPALANPMFQPGELAHMFSLTKPRAILSSTAKYDAAVAAAEKYLDDCGVKLEVFVFDEEHERSYLKLLVQPGAEILKKNDKILEQVQFDTKNDEALYCFSSGTSGLPKAVRLSHSAIIANTIQMTATLGGRVNQPTVDDAHWYDQPKAPVQNGNNEFHYAILPQFHCYGMITSLINVHTATPCVITSRFSPEDFFEAVETYKVTFSFVVPPIRMYHFLTKVIALVRSPLAKRYDLSTIKSFASGAASLSKELCDLVHQKYGISVTDGK